MDDESRDHTDFQLAFTDGQSVLDSDGRAVHLHVIRAGDLAVTTGRIIACDPYLFEAQAFRITVPIGSHPVLLSIATFEADEQSERDQRVACALLRCTEATPVRWEPALTMGQDPTTLEPGEMFGYSVDAGTGCFVDEATVDAWLKASRLHTGGFHPVSWKDSERWYSRLTEEWFENGARLWANIPMAEYGGSNLIAFASGWGDGGYASFIGYDAQDQLVGIVTDFGVLLGVHQRS